MLEALICGRAQSYFSNSRKRKVISLLPCLASLHLLASYLKPSIAFAFINPRPIACGEKLLDALFVQLTAA
jgi:hypothetical protein